MARQGEKRRNRKETMVQMVQLVWAHTAHAKAPPRPLPPGSFQQQIVFDDNFSNIHPLIMGVTITLFFNQMEPLFGLRRGCAPRRPSERRGTMGGRFSSYRSYKGFSAKIVPKISFPASPRAVLPNPFFSHAPQWTWHQRKEPSADTRTENRFTPRSALRTAPVKTIKPFYRD